MLLYLAGARSLQAMGGLVLCVQGFWMPKEASVCVGALFGLGWSFFSGKLCKAELHSAGRLFVAGLKCLPEL